MHKRHILLIFLAKLSKVLHIIIYLQAFIENSFLKSPNKLFTLIKIIKTTIPHIINDIEKTLDPHGCLSGSVIVMKKKYF